MTEEVTKGGKCYIEIDMDRAPAGLVIRVKAVPEVEEFMKGLGNGAADNVQLYGKDWFPIDRSMTNTVYNIDDRADAVVTPTYCINRVVEPLINSRDNRFNLSFLRLVGISSPQGVNFTIATPFSKPYVRGTLSPRISEECKNLLRDFIVPLHINLRISSLEA